MSSGNGNGNVNGDTSNLNEGVDDDQTTTKVPAGFPPAAKVSFNEANRLIVDGEVEDADEVAVYDLGAMSIGDQIDVLCIASSGSSLDPMIALFDDEGYRIFEPVYLSEDAQEGPRAFKEKRAPRWQGR